MSNKIFISGSEVCHRVVVTDANNTIDDLFFAGSFSKSIKANIYLAKVVRIEPSLQAAFVNYGNEKSGFLPFSEIHNGYYNNSNIPLSDVLKYELDSKEKNNENESKNKEDEKDESSSLTDIEKIEFSIEDQHEEEEKILYTNKKIQDVIEVGQKLLVQVFRDERGNKGVSMTTFITIPTRYCIFTPNNKKLHGVSKRVPDQIERDRLRNILNQIKTSNQEGLVVRTAACGAQLQELENDYKFAIKIWNEMCEKVKSSNEPRIIKKSESVIVEVIKNCYRQDSRIFVDNENLYNEILTISENCQINKDSIIVYRNDVPLFDKFGLSSQINELYKDRVNLKSGGYLIINHTEALVSIDINSGRLINERNIEGTALKTNLEAVEEICRQIRLRDIGGLIVVDFIDMEDSQNRKSVEMKMKNILSLTDKARVQFIAISPFGLMEISRQRLRTSFIEASTTKCNNCNGFGRILLSDIIIEEVKAAILKNVKKNQYKYIQIKCSPQISSSIISNHRSDILEIENEYSVNIGIMPDGLIRGDSFVILGSDNNENKLAMVEIAKSNRDSFFKSKQDDYDSSSKFKFNKPTSKADSKLNKKYTNSNRTRKEDGIFKKIFKVLTIKKTVKPKNEIRSKSSPSNKEKTTKGKTTSQSRAYNKTRSKKY